MSNLGNTPDIVIIGRPNVGKSSLMNRLAGRNEQIVTHKPHTTRSNHQISIKLGDVTAFIEDTPGLVSRKPLIDQRMMRRSVGLALEFAKVVLVVVDVRHFSGNDEYLLKKSIQSGKPMFVAINKIDLVDKQYSMDYCRDLEEKLPGLELIPISAKKNKRVTYLANLLNEAVKVEQQAEQQSDRLKELPIQNAQVPTSSQNISAGDAKQESSDLAAKNHEDTPITLNEEELTYQVIQRCREQLLTHLHAELPYVCKLRIIQMDNSDEKLRINIDILVPKKSNVPIVLGKGGVRLKSIGTKARLNLSRYLHKPVQLFLKVKVIPENKQKLAGVDLI